MLSKRCNFQKTLEKSNNLTASELFHTYGAFLGQLCGLDSVFPVLVWQFKKESSAIKNVDFSVIK